MVASPLPNDTPYVSVPTSPTKCSLNNVYFYSVPTSPTRGVSEAPSSCESGPRTPKTHEDVSCKFGAFEFETSHYFDFDGFEFEKSQNFEYLLDHDQEQQQQCGDSQPAMAFADELFCNGQVLPLKLPPRLQNVNGNKSGNLSPTASSPMSPSSVLRLTFLRRTLWNDDYDPFTAALKNVKAEQKDLACGSHHRRARSLSPLRAITPQRSSDSIGLNPQASMPHSGPNPNQYMKNNGSAYASWLQFRNKAMGSSKPAQQGGKGPNTPAKTKGLATARRVRNLKVGQERLDSLIELAGHTGKTVQGQESEGSCTVETRRQRIKAFLSRSASMGGESSKEKPRNRIEALWKPPQNSRGWSFRKSIAAVHFCGKGRVYQEMKTSIQYRPRLFLCFGFGIRCPRNINWAELMETLLLHISWRFIFFVIINTTRWSHWHQCGPVGHIKMGLSEGCLWNVVHVVPLSNSSAF